MVTIIVIVRTLLDYVDGEMARTCNTGSTIGSYLDAFNDSIQTTMIIYWIIQNFTNQGSEPRFDTKQFSLVFGLVMLSTLSNVDVRDHTMTNPVAQLFHDNMIMVNLVALLVWARYP